MEKTPSVIAILSWYKRPYTLIQQLKAVQWQTVPPKEIYFVLDNCWNEETQRQFWDIIKENHELFKDVKIITSNFNFWVWFRFQVALHCNSDFICVFDDDTIPGSKRFANCIESYLIKPWLYWTIWLRFQTYHDYYSHRRIGWANPNEEIEEVDIVWHARFFTQEQLRIFADFWKPYKRDDSVWNKCWEDISFSFALRQYDIETYVAPHPENDKEKRWSIPSFARQYWADKNANFLEHIQKYNIPFRYLMDKIGSSITEFNHFRNDFDEYWRRIFFDKKPIALTRYWDWEYNLIHWIKVAEWSQALSVDHRSYQWWQTKLWTDLAETLKHIESNWIYWLPCSCCNDELKLKYIDSLSQFAFKTYANLFINGNYIFFEKKITEIEEEVVVIWNYRGEKSLYPFPIKTYIGVPDDCVNYYEEFWEVFKGKLRDIQNENFWKNQLVLISAWPLSEIIIDTLFNNNPNWRYVDVWSALDPRIHWKQTRWYMIKWNPYHSKNCIF